MRSDFLPQTDGIGIVREAAKNWLIANGVQFNGAAEAVFYAPVGRQKMTLGTTGATSVFLPSFGRVEGGGEFRALGNAILCAQPLDDFRAVPLPKPPNRSRQYHLNGVHQGLLASINLDGRRVTLGVVHLERFWDPEGRSLQAETFLSGIGDTKPAIIGGDFNTATVDMDRRWGLLRACVAMAFHPRRFRRPEPYEPLFDRIRAHGFSIDRANVPGMPSSTRHCSATSIQEAR